MSPQIVAAVDEISLVGPISAAMLRDLPRATAIGTLSLTAKKPKPFKMRTLAERAAKPRLAYFTQAVAHGLGGIHSLDKLWLWLKATPAALRHVFAIPGLRVVDLLGLAPPGRLSGFSASKIEEFRCNSGLRESDLLEISASVSLEQLGAQSAELSIRAITALIAMPKLLSLDIEGSNFNDAMAALLCGSDVMQSLEVGATSLTGKGLAHLRTMKKLAVFRPMVNANY